MIFIMLAAAAAATTPLPVAPTPIRPENWLTLSDYPAIAIRQNVEGVVYFAVTISTEGKVIRCAIERSSGSKLLDDTVCDIMKKRARFQQARNGEGQPAVGIYRSLANFILPDDKPRGPPTKFFLSPMAVHLSQMPQDLANPTYVQIALSVSAVGKVIACSAKPGTADSPQEVKAIRLLGPTACSQALATLTLEPALDADGKAVPSVQTVHIAFTSDPTGQ